MASASDKPDSEPVEPPEQADPERVVVVFTSPFASLLLQDAGGVWAHFSGGRFETDDPELADRLRSAEGVTEVDMSEPTS